MTVQILNTKESYDLASAFLDVCPSRLKTGVPKQTNKQANKHHTQMFTEVLFTISCW